jgi:transposase-like protein
VNETTLRNWVHAHLAEEARAADPVRVSRSEFEELRRLRAENAELRVEKEILREAAAYFARETIRSAASGSPAGHRGAWGDWRLCRVLGVSRSGFYAWANRPVSPRRQADQALTEAIGEIYVRSRCTYGAPRVHGELVRRGVRCGRKRVARLMRESGLAGVHARRRWRKARSGDIYVPDLVRRNFDPAGPDELQSADVTQFRTGEGWLYLAAVIDLWSRRAIGWPRR